jgi:hypothetical protein
MLLYIFQTRNAVYCCMATACMKKSSVPAACAIALDSQHYMTATLCKRLHRLFYNLEIVSSIYEIAWYGAQPKPHVPTEHKNLSADATDMLSAIWVCPMLLLMSCMKTSSTQPHAYSFFGPLVAAGAANSTSGWHVATLQCCTMQVQIFIVAPIFLSANVC